MVYLGVDLHRKLSHVVALDDAGGLVFERRFDHSPDAFRRVFGDLEPEPVSVVFEATYGWGWFADLLVDAGIEAHMAHPLATKAISAGRVKNDAVDARTLAHLLRTHLLPEAWIAPPEVRDGRRLVRMRVSLVRMRSRLKSQVHAICADAGVPVAVTDLFGRAGREQLASVALRPVIASRLAANLRLIEDIGREVIRADRELQALFRGDDRVRRLMAIPGIGFLTAVTIVAEVGEIGRFPSADRLASWAGLTPTEHSSADHTRRGHITKQGSRWLRWTMVEAAARIGRAPSLHRFADPIERRRGGKIARVALARRLLTLAFYALRDPDGCRAYPPLRRSSRSLPARSS
jgi:transposase